MIGSKPDLERRNPSRGSSTSTFTLSAGFASAALLFWSPERGGESIGALQRCQSRAGADFRCGIADHAGRGRAALNGPDFTRFTDGTHENPREVTFKGPCA